MKTIYIVRHAKSSWDNLDLPDSERPLNERGIHDAPMMGKRLKERGVMPDLILTSTAVRALATGRAIAHELGYPEERIKVEKRIYHASEEQLLSVIKDTARKAGPEILLVVGHNPGLTGFSNRLLDDAIDTIPTCGIVTGKLNIESWEELTWQCGERESLDTPK